MGAASGAAATLRRNPALRSSVATARRMAGVGAQLRATVRKGASVVYYHRIVDSERDPWQLGVTPAHFAEQVEALAASGRPLLTFAEMVTRLREDRLPERAVAVTFDDGYADNALVATPVLERAGVPATVFVVVDGIDAPGELWWDEVERIFLAEPDLPASLDLELAGRRFMATLGGEGPVDPRWLNHQESESTRAGLFLAVWRHLLTVGLDERDEAMDALAEWSGRPRTARPDRRLLRSAELDAMVASPAIEIGCHTFRHPNLTLPHDRHREVAEARAALGERVGAPVATFAYPNGYHDDAAVAAVADAGYLGAGTTVPGVVRPGASPFTVPRSWVPDVGGDAVERWERSLG